MLKTLILKLSNCIYYGPFRELACEVHPPHFNYRYNTSKLSYVNIIRCQFHICQCLLRFSNNLCIARHTWVLVLFFFNLVFCHTNLHALPFIWKNLMLCSYSMFSSFFQIFLFPIHFSISAMYLIPLSIEASCKLRNINHLSAIHILCHYYTLVILESMMLPYTQWILLYIIIRQYEPKAIAMVPWQKQKLEDIIMPQIWI